MRFFGTTAEFVDEVGLGSLRAGRCWLAHRQVAAQNAPALMQVSDLGAGIRRTIERAVAGCVIGNRNFETGAEVFYGLFGELLLLVSGVAALDRAEPVTLDGFRQDERRAALVLGRHFVGVVN